MLDIGSIEKHIASTEARVHNLRPNIEKKILWAHKAAQKTSLSIVFVMVFLQLELNLVLSSSRLLLL
jgi:hypothetical protein